jgi:hypothetical protein
VLQNKVRARLPLLNVTLFVQESEKLFCGRHA